MPALLQVALGGALGAMLRYLTVQSSVRLFGAGFPYGTMIVNVAGSFAMGLAMVYLLERGAGLRISPLVMAGILGGFTTFSAFSLDILTLVEKGRMASASLYLLGSVGLSVAAIFVGVMAMRMVLS